MAGLEGSVAALYLLLLLHPASGQGLPDTNPTQTDGELLLAFKNTFRNGTAAPSTGNWSSGDPCTWRGILCNSTGAVTSM
jgi:hypothetical protein